MPRESRISDENLRSLARERIADGRLPIMFPQTMQAGYGSGATCCLCDQPIELQQIEYEVTHDRDGRRLSFHLPCHAIWQLECGAWASAGGSSIQAERPSPMPPAPR